MTVCTASLFNWVYGEKPDGTLDIGPAFMIAADRMLTDVGLGIEYETSRWKATIVRDTHMVFVAGDFTFHSEALATVLAALPEGNIRTPDLANLLSAAFIHVRNARLERRYVAPLGLTMERLAADQSALNPDLVLRLQEQLQSHHYDVEAMVVGVNDRVAGMYRIDEFGVITNHADIGFLSIGVGGIHSSAQFMYQPYTHHQNYFEAVYATFVAKKRAEVAPGVGPGTDVFRINANGVATFPAEIVHHLDRMYQGERVRSARRVKAAIKGIETREAAYFAKLDAEKARNSD